MTLHEMKVELERLKIEQEKLEVLIEQYENPPEKDIYPKDICDGVACRYCPIYRYCNTEGRNKRTYEDILYNLGRSLKIIKDNLKNA